MPDDGFQFFGSSPAGVAEIYFVVKAGFRDVEGIALFFHVSVHKLNGSRFVVVRSDVYTLHT